MTHRMPRARSQLSASAVVTRSEFHGCSLPGGRFRAFRPDRRPLSSRDGQVTPSSDTKDGHAAGSSENFGIAPRAGIVSFRNRARSARCAGSQVRNQRGRSGAKMTASPEISAFCHAKKLGSSERRSSCSVQKVDGSEPRGSCSVQKVDGSEPRGLLQRARARWSEPRGLFRAAARVPLLPPAHIGPPEYQSRLNLLPRVQSQIRDSAAPASGDPSRLRHTFPLTIITTH
jgi:hypothetical protein